MSPTHVILAVWLTLLGGCVGSFINVVIYRVPRGLSLLYPGSQCPQCGHAIRWYHNIPVLGWLIISGRCHDCGARVSIRYPTIEAIVAGMFLVVAWRGPLAAMPLDKADPIPGSSIPLAVWVTYAYQLVLLCGLLVMAVMEIDAASDRQVRVPWRLVCSLILVGLLVPLAWSSLAAVAATGGLRAWEAVGWLPSAVGDRLLGLGAAVLLALAVRPAATESVTTMGGRRFAAAGFLLSGAFLGGVPVCLLGAATAAVHLLATLLARVLAWQWSPPWTPIVWALTLGGLLGWGLAQEGSSGRGPWWLVLVVLVLVSVTGVLSLGSLISAKGGRRGTD